MLGAAPGRGRDRAGPCSPPTSRPAGARQERREVRRDADRAHARAAAAVRDAEGLVQVQVADVGRRSRRGGTGRPARSCSRRPCRPGRRGVHHAQISRDRLLEHAVGRRVGHHQRRELVSACSAAFARRSARSMLPCSSQATTTTSQARHHRAGRVGAVRRGRDQADVAVPLAARQVVGADHRAARVLALRARVRLQRDRREAGDLGTASRSSCSNIAAVAKRPARGREGVQRAELRPGDGIISLAALSFIVHEPERDHRVRQRQVAAPRARM
jgi:hypothetical protein